MIWAMTVSRLSVAFIPCFSAEKKCIPFLLSLICRCKGTEFFPKLVIPRNGDFLAFYKATFAKKHSNYSFCLFWNGFRVGIHLTYLVKYLRIFPKYLNLLAMYPKILFSCRFVK